MRSWITDLLHVDPDVFQAAMQAQIAQQNAQAMGLSAPVGPSHQPPLVQGGFLSKRAAAAAAAAAATGGPSSEGGSGRALFQTSLQQGAAGETGGELLSIPGLLKKSLKGSTDPPLPPTGRGFYLGFGALQDMF